jgi:hypothetical protein
MNRVRSTANIIIGICFEMAFAAAIILWGLVICGVAFLIYR